jgi:Na+-driven multidrug efflux pump
MIIFIAVLPVMIVNFTSWGMYALYGSLILDETIRAGIVFYRLKTVDLRLVNDEN